MSPHEMKSKRQAYSYVPEIDSFTYREEVVIELMREYGRQERDKALEFLTKENCCRVTKEMLEKYKRDSNLAI